MNLVFWTDLADGSIMFPLGIAIPLVLAILGQRRAAVAWTVVVLCVWATMLVLKLAGYTIAATYPGSVFSRLGLLTPSGHVASSSAIYGSLVGLLLPRPGTPVQRSLLAALAIAVLIAITRVLLGDHSLAEVVVGATVGVVGAAALARLADAPVARRARLPLVATTLAIVLAFHGDHSNWEETIRDTAIRLSQLWT